jgi:DNA repair protein RecO (recombination protein O)
MLTELGFGLDLDQCAATGTTADLIYVSPKSGRAVSRVAGEPWHDRMLHLPALLRTEWNGEPETGDLSQAFALTGFFLQRHVLDPRGLAMHEARASFIGAVLRGVHQPETVTIG